MPRAFREERARLQARQPEPGVRRPCAPAPLDPETDCSSLAALHAALPHLQHITFRRSRTMSSMRFPRALHALSLSLLALAVAGCGDSTGPGKGVKLTPELVRLNGSSGGASGSLAGHVLSLAVEGPGTTAAIATSDVDIMSLRMPITEIMIGSDESERVATAYRCTVDDCHVDLAAANFESNLLQSSSVTVPVGTYTWVQFGFCTNDRDSHDVYLTASVNMDGTVYYTRPDGSLSTESPAQAAKITMSGCAIRSEMPHAVIVEDNGVVQAAPEDE